MAAPQKISPLLIVRKPAMIVSKGMIEYRTRIKQPQKERAKTSSQPILLAFPDWGIDMDKSSLNGAQPSHAAIGPAPAGFYGIG
jgi:hypothetical protein